MNSFALPDPTRIIEVRLRTANLERALDFYCGVLGFKIANEKGAEITLAPAGHGAGILVLSHEPQTKPRPRRSTGLYHVAIRYPTRRALAQALERLIHHRYSLEGASDHDVSEALYLSDPEHNGVELYADRPRQEWVWRDGQVTMGTRALDLEKLLDTLGGQSELAAPPPETEIGHIHLHVADLEQAEKFYQGFLGMAVTQRSYPGALFFSIGGYHHHIATNIWGGHTKPPENSVGLMSYRLEVPDRQVLSELRKRARLPELSPSSENFGTARDCLRIPDPNGNCLEIGYARPKRRCTG